MKVWMLACCGRDLHGEAVCVCVCYVAWKIELILCYVLVGVVEYKNGWKVHEKKYANVYVLAEWYSKFHDEK